MRDQAERLRKLAAGSGAEAEPSSDSVGRVVAVTSGKGGVGKTNLVANLGTALAARGLRVTILDADFGLANLDIVLNLNPRRNLGHLLRGEAEADDIVVEPSPGLRIIPGASGIEALANLGPAERKRLLTALAPLSADSDFLLIDTAAGIGRNVVALCAAATEVALVTNSEPTSLTDAYGLVKVLFAQRADTVVRVVVNSTSGSEEGRAVHARLSQVVERFLGRKIGYLGHIQRDPCVSRATQRQAPFVTAYPRSAASRCVEVLADVLRSEAAARPRSGGEAFWGRFLAAGDER